MGTPASLVPADIVSRIVSIRGQRVLFDYDLAAVYGVTTKRLNQQVNRTTSNAFQRTSFFTLILKNLPT